jgi:hypothetical protein
MEFSDHYKADCVNSSERLARIVLSPRDLDPVTNYPKDTFIGLRQDETGISFLRFDLMGEEAFRRSGIERAALYNGKSKKKHYAFAGWMEGVASEIKALAPGEIQITVNSPSERPEHVNVEFLMDGEVVKGIVTDARVLDVIDELYHYLKYVKV